MCKLGMVIMGLRSACLAGFIAGLNCLAVGVENDAAGRVDEKGRPMTLGPMEGVPAHAADKASA